MFIYVFFVIYYVAQGKSYHSSNDACPHACVHTIHEHADTIIIDMIILPLALNFDGNAYLLSMSRRQSFWTCEDVCIMPMFDHLRRWISAATSQISTCLANWVSWCTTQELSSSTPCILRHLRQILCLNTSNYNVILGVLWKWVQLLQSNDVMPYYCEHEQVGLMTTRVIRNGEAIDCGPSFTRRIGIRSRDSVPFGVRWSTTEGRYLGGGPSLLNHACVRHANALIEYDNGNIVLAIEDIEIFTPVRIVYDDCLPLFETRRIVCGVCAGINNLRV